jgi:DNA-binding PadR family transcriptional regulator
LPYALASLSEFVNTAELMKVDLFVRRYRRGAINSLLEYIILVNLADARVCGYDIIRFVHDRFHVLLSPGQVYPVIDFLAKQGLVHKEKEGRKVLLGLSNLGKSLLKSWQYEHNSIELQLNNLIAKQETAT